MAGASSLNKGKGGEREVATLLNGLLMSVMRDMGFPEQDVIAAATSIQRNQNQSAVGGGDLSNTLGLCVEVKRHETPQFGPWWQQVCEAADRNDEVPVLIYRANRSKWRVRMNAMVPIEYLAAGRTFNHYVQADISWDDFVGFFKAWVRRKLTSGAEIRT